MQEEQKKSDTTESTDNKMEEVEGKTAAELLSLGMKSFWAANYKHAVQYLGKSSEKLVEEHKDDKHDSLAEVYLFYGKTLLELSREEGDPLGEAVPKEVGMEDDGSDDDEEGAESGEDQAMDGEEKSKTDDEKANGSETEKADTEKTSTDKSSTEENKCDDAKVIDKTDIKINGESASSSSREIKEEDAATEDASMEADDGDEAEESDDADAGEGTSGDKAAEEDESTDLQLAWQVLELARIILERRGDAAKAEYADCLITLGEVSLENEAFDGALTDIKAGLEIQQKLYKEDVSKQRRLAETCYKLGLAHATNNQIEDGVKCYEQCVELLKKRMTSLETTTSEQDKKELADIGALVPEIEEKITDLKNYKEEAAKTLEAAKEPAFVASPEKKANDISHLVKRKRKLDESTSEEQPPKKPTP